MGAGQHTITIHYNYFPITIFSDELFMPFAHCGQAGPCIEPTTCHIKAMSAKALLFSFNGEKVRG